VNRTHYLISTPEHRDRLVTCGEVKSGIQGEYDGVFQLRGLCLMHGALPFDIDFIFSLERYVKKLIKADDISYLAEDIKKIWQRINLAIKVAEEFVKEKNPDFTGIPFGGEDEVCTGDMWLHLRAVRGEFQPRDEKNAAAGAFATGSDVNTRNSILAQIKSILDRRRISIE
jgi:hypothetical protein